MPNFDDEEFQNMDDDEEGPDSINEIYGHDDPEDNDETAFDDVLKIIENGQ